MEAFQPAQDSEQLSVASAAERCTPEAPAPAAAPPPAARSLATVSVPPLGSNFAALGTLTPPVSRRIRSETVSDTGQSATAGASCAGEGIFATSSADYAAADAADAATAAAAGGRGSCPGLETRGSLGLGERAASSSDLLGLQALAQAAAANGDAGPGGAGPPADVAVTSGPLPRIRGLGIGTGGSASGGASGGATPVAGGGASPFFRGAPQAGLAFASPAAAGAGPGERARVRARVGGAQAQRNQIERQG
jgi:hypothetical protein